MKKPARSSLAMGTPPEERPAFFSTLAPLQAGAPIELLICRFRGLCNSVSGLGIRSGCGGRGLGGFRSFNNFGSRRRNRGHCGFFFFAAGRDADGEQGSEDYGVFHYDFPFGKQDFDEDFFNRLYVSSWRIALQTCVSDRP
jgi:hypothetical protein